MQYKLHVIVCEEHPKDNWVYCIYYNHKGYWKRLVCCQTEQEAKKYIDEITATLDSRTRSG